LEVQLLLGCSDVITIPAFLELEQLFAKMRIAAKNGGSLLLPKRASIASQGFSGYAVWCRVV
jgi:hypothetical protein